LGLAALTNKKASSQSGLESSESCFGEINAKTGGDCGLMGGDH